MNIKGFRRMLLGEKMPDRNDPKYKERYERDVEAGRKFAKATRIDKAAAKVQGFANVHRTLFLVIVFAFVLGGLAWNIYRITVVYPAGGEDGDRDAGFGIEGAAQDVAGRGTEGNRDRKYKP